MGRRSDHTREELRELMLKAARGIVRDSGVAALSSRKVANQVGYTVGTIFQVFGNMDHLVVELNIATLKRLYEHCRTAPHGFDAEARIRNLANAFLTFANENKNEWDAVISYQYSKDLTQLPEYREQVLLLHAAISDSISEFYSKDDEAQRMDDVSLLWTSLYGIFVLASASKLTAGYDAERMLESLITLYLDARAKSLPSRVKD